MEFILDKHRRNLHNLDQFFCIVFEIEVLFDLILGIVNLLIKDMILININYNNLSIKCCYHLLIIHLMKEYLAL